MSPALEGAGPLQPNAPAALKPEASHSGEGPHQGGGMNPSVPRGRSAIIANLVGWSPAALSSSAVQDDLHASDLLEGGLDFRQKE